MLRAYPPSEPSGTLRQPNHFIGPLYMRFLLVLTLSSLLCACGSSAFDQSREWRLQECEKILDDADRSNCKTNTPYYK